MSVRDETAEQRFFEAAAGGQTPTFVAHATNRLELGQELYGDAWAQRGIAGLVDELLEEAADLGAWAALAIQTLDDSPGDEFIRTLLDIASLHAARAHSALTIAAGRAAGRRVPALVRPGDTPFRMPEMSPRP